MAEVGPADLKEKAPLLVDTPEAARLCGISAPTWYRLRAAGRIGPAEVRLGGRVLYDLSELREWVASRAANGRLPGRREWQALRGAQRNGR
jgi:predicted DNA-binding transcriptional regulator AlpA